jgi:hypothetical protein
MDALRRSVGQEAAPAKASKGAKKPRKAGAGQKEMLMPIAGKKPPKEAAAKKPAAKSQRNLPESVGEPHNMKEASAMTEASGVVNEREQPAEPRRPRSREDAAMVWADRLRKATVQAPLQSLPFAFVLGMWFARRR